MIDDVSWVLKIDKLNHPRVMNKAVWSIFVLLHIVLCTFLIRHEEYEDYKVNRLEYFGKYMNLRFWNHKLLRFWNQKLLRFWNQKLLRLRSQKLLSEGSLAISWIGWIGLSVKSLLVIDFPLMSVQTLKVYSTVGSIFLNLVFLALVEFVEKVIISVSPTWLSRVNFLGFQLDIPFSNFKAWMESWN